MPSRFIVAESMPQANFACVVAVLPFLSSRILTTSQLIHVVVASKSGLSCHTCESRPHTFICTLIAVAVMGAGMCTSHMVVSHHTSHMSHFTHIYLYLGCSGCDGCGQVLDAHVNQARVPIEKGAHDRAQQRPCVSAVPWRVNVWVREREREFVCVYVSERDCTVFTAFMIKCSSGRAVPCKRERENERESVCVCEREQEKSAHDQAQQRPCVHALS